MLDFLSRLLDTTDFPGRWNCGVWTDGHGWLHILSDLAIWAAYFAIPILLLAFVRHRTDVPFRNLFLLFGAFIVLCGSTHLMEAAIFWWPAYRLAGVLKLTTAVVSWATVAALIPVLPRALALRSPAALESEVRKRTAELVEVNSALRQSENQLKAVLDQMPSGVIIAEAPSGRILNGNRRVEEIWRHRVPHSMDVEAYSQWRGLHPDGRPYEPAEWPLARAVRSGETIHSEEAEILRGDDSRGIISISAAPICDETAEIVAAVAVLEDVTVRREAEAALRDREERLRSIVDTAADAIITIDDSGTIGSFNPAAERMFGYSAPAAIGHKVRLLIAPPYSIWQDYFLACHHTDGERQSKNTVRRLVGRRQDGTRFPIELAVSEIDHMKHFTWIIRDVSERESLQDQLISIAEEEQRRIGQDLHDDVGQELTGLGLTAETLLEALEEQALPEANIASRVVVALRRTHEKVRLLSQGLLPVEIDAEGLASALSELALRLEASEGVQCRFDYPQPVGIPDARIAVQLFRIAQEAVANAIRHARAQHIWIRLLAGEGYVRLVIDDDGIGFTEPTVVRGSGLRIMRYRAESMGGYINIGPAKGGGTRVMCEIPEMP